jgi:hypothetical protein
VAQVRGYADRQLRHPEEPEAASNRRISVIVQYLTPPPGKEGAAEPEKGKEAEKNGETGKAKRETEGGAPKKGEPEKAKAEK